MAKRKSTPAPEPDPLMGIDAQKWAKEFMRIWSGRWSEVDEGLMIGWFANAIMRGFDEGQRRLRKQHGCELPPLAEPKPSATPAPEPKQGSEEPQLGTVEPLNAGQIVALRAENERLQGIIMGTSAEYRVTLGVNLRRYWSAENQVMLGRMLFDEDVPALRAELAASDQNLKTMLQAAGEEAERQLAAAREEIAVRDASISDYARQMADIREHWHAEATENVTLKADLAAEKARADRAEGLAMAASVPQGQRTRAVGKPCLCGYGTFRDTHASNCDEPKESEVNDK